jgi:hypothetical protein
MPINNSYDSNFNNQPHLSPRRFFRHPLGILISIVVIIFIIFALLYIAGGTNQISTSPPPPVNHLLERVTLTPDQKLAEAKALMDATQRGRVTLTKPQQTSIKTLLKDPKFTQRVILIK